MKSSIRVVAVSSKGQIVIPEEFREELNLKKGSSLVMIREGRTLFLKREDDVRDEFADLLKISEKSLEDIWGSEKEDVWNKYLE
ncbi:AbrB/MazE/SpoVT family DNA-binding domain-containing protein [Candidatus Woesearchaeota archaeon]|nr:AbrB/MazE/SpoVT family DNA-binding domain-containing protein [Candidatus Woesearchaeota archaeon]